MEQGSIGIVYVTVAFREGDAWNTRVEVAFRKRHPKHITHGNDVTDLVAYSHMLLGQLHHYTTEKLPASPLPASQPAEDHCEHPYSTLFTVQIIIQTVVAYTPFSRKPTLSVFIPAPISLLATASPVPIQAINGPRNS